MNVLILGSGGREHTLAWKISQSPLCTKLFVAPGNAGTSSLAENINIDPVDFSSVGKISIEKNIDLIIVGPEVPLVLGIVDFFRTNPLLNKIKIIGPDKKGAILEGSKDFSKQFMKKYNIPTASSKTFTKNSLTEGLTYLENHSLPIVLKADGLASGKGVIIAESLKDAQASFREMLEDNKFGEAGSKVVVEQYLTGIELSVFVIADGKDYLLLPEAKDYKRIGEGDKGLNTGGMGAVSPVPFADNNFMQKVEQKIIKPTMNGLSEEGISYTGFIFFGLINVEGEPFVIEYNARLGDPETEVIIPRIKNDFLEICEAAANQNLKKINIKFENQTATTIMLVAGGYPESYDKGNEITGLENVEDVFIFHAGTKLSEKKIVTNGGRVLALTSLGKDIPDALQKSNKAASVIRWNKKYYRKDIGLDLVKLTEADTQ